jgi:hypothetical protein
MKALISIYHVAAAALASIKHAPAVTLASIKIIIFAIVFNTPGTARWQQLLPMRLRIDLVALIVLSIICYKQSTHLTWHVATVSSTPLFDKIRRISSRF